MATMMRRKLYCRKAIFLLFILIVPTNGFIWSALCRCSADINVIITFHGASGWCRRLENFLIVSAGEIIVG